MVREARINRLLADEHSPIGHVTEHLVNRYPTVDGNIIDKQRVQIVYLILNYLLACFGQRAILRCRPLELAGHDLGGLHSQRLLSLAHVHMGCDNANRANLRSSRGQHYHVSSRADPDPGAGHQILNDGGNRLHSAHGRHCSSGSLCPRYGPPWGVGQQDDRFDGGVCCCCLNITGKQLGAGAA